MSLNPKTCQQPAIFISNFIEALSPRQPSPSLIRQNYISIITLAEPFLLIKYNAIKMISRQNLLPLSILLLSVLLLLVLTFHRDSGSPLQTKRGPLAGLHLHTKIVPVSSVPTTSSKSIGLPFGLQHPGLEDLSTPLLDSALTKRAPPREPRAWPDLVCAGGALLDKIQAAFLGSTPPGREFSSGDLDNGWEKSTETAGEALMILGRYWSSVFDGVYPESRGKSLNVKPVNLYQTGKYKTDDGTAISVYHLEHFAAFFSRLTSSVEPYRGILVRIIFPGFHVDHRDKFPQSIQRDREAQPGDIERRSQQTASSTQQALRSPLAELEHGFAESQRTSLHRPQRDCQPADQINHGLSIPTRLGAQITDR